MNEITEKTLLPLSFVIGILGAIFWVSTLYNTTKANESDSKEVKVSQKENQQVLIEILQRLSRIEEKLTKGDK